MGSLKTQTSLEYLILVGIGVLVVLIATGAFVQVSKVMINEYNAFLNYEENIGRVIMQ